MGWVLNYDLMVMIARLTKQKVNLQQIGVVVKEKVCNWYHLWYSSLFYLLLQIKYFCWQIAYISLTFSY
jgi:hypothetical protein